MIKELREYDDITQPINEIADEINSVLHNRKKDRYFEKIVLLYSFIENILKWLVFVKLVWERCCSNESVKLSGAELDEQANRVESFSRSLSFYHATNLAYSVALINYDLYRRIEHVRKQRNNIVHQFWLYSHRNDFSELRKTLKELAKVAKQLVGVLDRLSEEIGVDSVYQYFR